MAQMQERVAGLESDLQNKAALVHSLENDLLDMCATAYPSSPQCTPHLQPSGHLLCAVHEAKTPCGQIANRQQLLLLPYCTASHHDPDSLLCGLGGRLLCSCR
jgi:hypothetical protein